MCAFPCWGATGRARNSARAPVINPLQHGPRGVVQDDVAAREHPLGDLEEPIPAYPAAADAPPGERWDVLGRSHALEDARAGTNHGPRAKQRADRRLGVVPDQAAEKLQAGLESGPRDLEAHSTVRVLQRSEEHTSELQSPCN